MTLSGPHFQLPVCVFPLLDYRPCSTQPAPPSGIYMLSSGHLSTSCFNHTNRRSSVSSPHPQLLLQPFHHFCSSFQRSPPPSVKHRHLNWLQNSQISLSRPIKHKVLSQLLCTISPLTHPRMKFSLLAEASPITRKILQKCCFCFTTLGLHREKPA